MIAKASMKYDPPIYKQGYRLTFVRNQDNEIIGVLVEGPRVPRPLYIPKTPGSNMRVKLPEHVLKLLRKNGFNL